jgi:hypothetical protein
MVLVRARFPLLFSEKIRPPDDSLARQTLGCIGKNGTN